MGLNGYKWAKKGFKWVKKGQKGGKVKLKSSLKLGEIKTKIVNYNVKNNPNRPKNCKLFITIDGLKHLVRSSLYTSLPRRPES